LLKTIRLDDLRHKSGLCAVAAMQQSGIDIKTLQTFLDHKKIATTEKYPKSLRLGDPRRKVESSTFAAMF
jgi:site-specific recombinase XerD